MQTEQTEPVSQTETTPIAPIPIDEEMVVYLVVNTDLGMGAGKTAAQVGHAVQYLMMKREETLALLDYAMAFGNEEHTKHVKQAFDFNKWHNSDSITKIVLAASAKDFGKVQTEYEGRCVVVKDAGRTEIASGSETVIGLYPMTKASVSKTIRRLRLLK